jgi:hypothetical protein
MKLWNKRTVDIPQHIVEMPEISRGIYSYIYCKRFEDLNYNLTTVGQPGRGKTTALLKMAWELQVDPKTLERNFDVEDQVVFTTEDFTRKIKETDQRLILVELLSLMKSRLKPTLNPGTQSVKSMP